ncbi:MAG TPA: nitroreductase family protein [Geminicoccaceae bacterium]|nr:nitroreductase family protein [Geminicoccaceae bacterium]
MPFNRRTLLAAGGASALLVSVGGGRTFVRAAPAAAPAASAPWAAAPASGHPDPRLRALGYAILAPNPHNRQPWLAELVGSDTILVHPDLDRRLPETDPFDRQITIGFGCFLELLRMAAAADGMAAEIAPFPAGEPAPRLDHRPVARVRLAPAADAAAADPLFAQVLDRRSNKQPYDTTRVVPEDVLKELQGAAATPGRVQASNRAALLAELRELTWQAVLVEAGTPRTHRESVRLVRIGRAEIDRQPDGIALAGPMVEELHREGVLTRETLADPGTPAFAQMLESYRDVTASAMAYLWLTSASDSRGEQLDAGRDWLRINLKATALGLGLHPLSQALQEYPEMADLHAAAHRLLEAPADGRVQMLGRVGYGPPLEPTPRWPLETRLVAA